VNCLSIESQPSLHTKFHRKRAIFKRDVVLKIENGGAAIWYVRTLVTSSNRRCHLDWFQGFDNAPHNVIQGFDWRKLTMPTIWSRTRYYIIRGQNIVIRNFTASFSLVVYLFKLAEAENKTRSMRSWHLIWSESLLRRILKYLVISYKKRQGI